MEEPLKLWSRDTINLAAALVDLYIIEDWIGLRLGGGLCFPSTFLVSTDVGKKTFVDG